MLIREFLTLVAMSMLAFVVLLSSANAQENQASAEKSRWAGQLKVGPNTLRLEVQVESSEGRQTGQLISLDQGNAKMEITTLKLDKAKFEFTIKAASASYEGAAQKDGSYKGKWKQSGREFDLAFSKVKSSLEKEKPAAKTLTKSDEKLLNAWIGRLDLGAMRPVMQFRIVEDKDGNELVYFDSVTEGQTGFEAAWKIEDGTLSFDVADIGLTFRGKLNEKENRAEGRWKQGGQNFALILEKRKSEFSDPHVWENRPQRPQAPFPYREEEVKVEHEPAGVTLAGTLTIPKGEGPFPAVVLISGSGPQDRDETLMGHKPFLVLADHFSRRGIAVLRYDDRGTAKSTGKFGLATSNDFANDASAVVDFLQKHPRIAKDKIALCGHSEGGLIAPIVAAKRSDLAAIVLMAGPGIDGVETAMTQSKAMSLNAGATEEQVDLSQRILMKVLEIAQSTESKSEVKEKVEAAIDEIAESLDEKQKPMIAEVKPAILGQVRRFTSPWFRFFLAYDPQTSLKKVKCPILAINGEKDLQVLPKLNLERIEKILEESNHDDFETIELVGLNHLFQKCENGSMGEYKSIDETFNPEAMKVMTDWLKKKLK